MRRFVLSLRGRLACALGAALVATGSPVFAAGDSQVTVIDFEDLPEGTSVSTQYAALGITFSIEGRAKLFPIIAREGNPTVAFTGNGADAPMASGAGGLTDPLVGGSANVPNDIRMNLSPAATSVSFYLADIETGETVVVTAFDGITPVASQTIVGGSAGTGNGVNTLATVSADHITSVLVDIQGAGAIGWGLDFVTVVRPCDEPGCSPRIRVSQESAPGVGDFGANILGELEIFSAPGTSAANLYAYDVPEADSWNGFIMTPVAERSHLLVALTLEGYTIFWVHDKADNADGGHAETQLELLGDLDGGTFSVQDDPAAVENGYYIGEPGDSLFQVYHHWNPCCSDGYGVSGLDCGGTAMLQFKDLDGSSTTQTIAGLNEWAVMGPGGEHIQLALQANRRVLLQHLPPTNCPADLNCDGVVNAADLAILLGAWGGIGAADLDASGDVNAADLAILLGEWGPC